ncbi:MAG TPA: UDP-N-acetylmuramate dehydrogenase [Smithellaceae bacterium]|nr:UDP-N-acetylmuramate dehydrogenase [Smithellaceae bacterium]
MAAKQTIADALGAIDTERIWFDEPMSRHASLGLGGVVDALVAPENEQQLATMVRGLKKKGIACMPAGNMTNILVTDGGYRGVVLWMKLMDKIKSSPGSGDEFVIDAQAGASLGRLVSLAADEGLEGLEFACGIPGSVGGAVRMNAGAYGKEMKDVLSTVTIIDAAGETKTLRRDEINFFYRGSDIPAEAIITGARFVVRKGNKEEIKKRMVEIQNQRRAKHPLEYPSAGSVFKNPPGLFAGRLIEELGLKGHRLGDVQVSKKHANFIVNKGQGTASEMLALIGFIREKAARERGVALETEIVIVGEQS